MQRRLVSKDYIQRKVLYNDNMNVNKMITHSLPVCSFHPIVLQLPLCCRVLWRGGKVLLSDRRCPAVIANQTLPLIFFWEKIRCKKCVITGFQLTSARAGRDRSFRRPSTTSSRPSAAAPATPGRSVNPAVSLKVVKTLPDTSIRSSIDWLIDWLHCFPAPAPTGWMRHQVRASNKR